MASRPPINVKSLREQVYEHLKAELKSGALDTGAFLDLNRLAAELGVSRTPLRDALIQLEVEEFVSIAPRRGVAVRALAVEDIKEIYQLVGALEASALLAAAPALGPDHFAHLRNLDRRAAAAVDCGDRQAYDENNYAFHDFFLERLGNGRITALVHMKKQQLYDWTRKCQGIHANWEHSGLHEHERIVALLEQGAAAEAAAYLRDVHWGFQVQESFVQQAYFSDVP